MIDWNLTWNMFTSIGTLLGVILTSILTYIILRQTNKINKEQRFIEHKINEQQIELQKRQLKIDIFPYKREIYVNILKVLEFAHFTYDLMRNLDIDDYSMKQLNSIYKTSIDSYIGDVPKINYCLVEAQYVFPQEISSIINQIYKNFDHICALFIAFNALDDILVGHSLADKVKKTNVENIMKSLRLITGYADFIRERIPKDIYIAGLDK